MGHNDTQWVKHSSPTHEESTTVWDLAPHAFILSPHDLISINNVDSNIKPTDKQQQQGEGEETSE